MLRCTRFPATSVSIKRPLLNGSAVDKRLSLQEVAILGGQASDASWYPTLVGLVDRSSTLTCRRIFIQPPAHVPLDLSRRSKHVAGPLRHARTIWPAGQPILPRRHDVCRRLRLGFHGARSRSDRDALYRTGQELGLGVTSWSLLRGRVLTGTYTREHVKDATPGRGERVTANLDERTFVVIDELVRIAGELDTTPAAVALDSAQVEALNRVSMPTPGVLMPFLQMATTIRHTGRRSMASGRRSGRWRRRMMTSGTEHRSAVCGGACGNTTRASGGSAGRGAPG